MKKAVEKTLNKYVAPSYPQSFSSAWDVWLRHQPNSAETMAPWEQEALRQMTPEQARAYAAGTSAGEIVLTNGQTLADFLDEKGETGFDLSWFSIDGGGGVSIGGGYRLTATIGQADAGVMTGGDYHLRSGFLAMDPTPRESPIFLDGFETGDLSKWSSSVGGP